MKTGVIALLNLIGNLLMELLTVWKARKEAKEEEAHQNEHRSIDDDLDGYLRSRGMLADADRQDPADSAGLPGDAPGDVRDIRTGREDQ